MGAHNIKRDQIETRLAERRYDIGDLRFSVWKDGAIRIECGEEQANGNMVGCLIPEKIVSAIREIPIWQQSGLVWWLGGTNDHGRAPFSRVLRNACCCCPEPKLSAQTKLAEHLGVTPGVVDRWCEGRHLPSIDQAREIAEWFHWDVEQTLRALRQEMEEKASRG